MRILLFNHLQNARQSIRSNKLRSALTMLGITIGVASITTILALNAGAHTIVRDQVDALGGAIAVVRPGAPQEHDISAMATIAAGNQGFKPSTLTQYDLDSIAQLPHIAAAAPIMILGGTVSGTSSGPPQTPIVASVPELAIINKLAVADGQFLDPNLAPSTAVIGAQLSVDLFGTSHSIGKTITIKGRPFTVVGVLKRLNQPINFNGVDFDAAAIISLESGVSLNQGALHIQQINILSESVEHLQGIVTATNSQLLKNHLGQVDFTVLSGNAIAQPTGQLFSAVAGASLAIAAISILVGGIGIMNIMLVSVAERTRELGIRKAVGASNGDIVIQFLIESLALSIGGGIIGYTLGYGIALLLSSFLTFSPIITWDIAGVALGLSVSVGCIFGIYPAIRAARKDPITALRHYE